MNQGSDPHNLRAIHPVLTRLDQIDIMLIILILLIHSVIQKVQRVIIQGDLDIGDVSRILMYMAVRYKSIDLILTDSKTLLNKGNIYR